jgi:hypothetical protein
MKYSIYRYYSHIFKSFKSFKRVNPCRQLAHPV